MDEYSQEVEALIMSTPTLPEFELVEPSHCYGWLI